jgi:8-oxo-dGTP diphosphatase
MDGNTLQISTPLWVVAAALVNPLNEILIQRRSPHRSMPGLWEFPGGKVETGETPEAALVRELREELGVDVDERALRPAGFASAPLGDVHLIMLLYICKEWRGVPEPLDSEAICWRPPNKLYDLRMPPADLPLIPILAALI